MCFLVTVNKIKQETDVMINIPDSDQGTTIIRIEGSRDGVQRAKKVSFRFSCVKKPYNQLMMTRSICYLSTQHETKNSTT